MRYYVVRVVEFGIIFSVISLVGLFGIQEAFAQYIGDPNPIREHLSDEEFKEISENLLQEYLDTILLSNENILKDTIKTKVWRDLTEPYPPFYYVRILYDEIQDQKIVHMDVFFDVNFTPVALHPENSKLDKKYENPYLTPVQIYKKIERYDRDTWFLYWIMCRQGFEEVQKISTRLVFCVKSESVEKLEDRGYASLRILLKDPLVIAPQYLYPSNVPPKLLVIEKFLGHLSYLVNKELWNNQMQDLIMTSEKTPEQINQDMIEAEKRFSEMNMQIPQVNIDIKKEKKNCKGVSPDQVIYCGSNDNKSIPITKIFEISQSEYVRQVRSAGQ